MCPCSYVYTVEDIQRMTLAQLGQAIWEYINDPVIDEMIESYGSVENTADAAVACFVDETEHSEPTDYILGLGNATMRAAVISYLEKFL